MMQTMHHRPQHSWLGVDTVVYDAAAAAYDDDAGVAADGCDDDDAVDTDEDDDDAVATDEDDTDGEDASQAPAFLAGCGHWTNIHFEMGLPTTPMHCIVFFVLAEHFAEHITAQYNTLEYGEIMQGLHSTPESSCATYSSRRSI